MNSDFVLMGKRIRELRKQKKLSQEELGNLIGVTKVSVSGYEKATRTPSLETLNDLVIALETNIDYLMGRNLHSKENDIFISNDDYEMLKEIKRNDDLYIYIVKNPKRAINIIKQKIKKII